MKMMEAFDLLLEARSGRQLIELRDELARAGYSEFYRFLERFKAYIKQYQDGQADEVLALIAHARDAVPNPGEISPSWTYIWEHLEKMTLNKNKVLSTVAKEDRGGEWQVLIDNPFENREVACYPGLSFDDAAFIFAQFRADLENNEYIRLQKIQTHITEFGRE